MKKSGYKRLTRSSDASFMAALVLTCMFLFGITTAEAHSVKKPTPNDASTEFSTSEKNAVIEQEMEVEDWMTNLNEDQWYLSSETNEAVETWMTNIYDDCWCIEDTEEDQKIENWMLTPEQWL